MNTSSNRIGGASPQVHFLREGTEFKILRALLKSIVLLPGIALFLSHCSNGDATNLFGDPRDWLLGPYRFSVHYTHPGRDEDTSQDKKIDQKLIELIDEADTSVDMAVYNLSRESVIDALIRAEERGLDVRMVGDVDEVVTDGYRSILRTNIPFSLGNSTAIQHNKFALIDGRYTFMGTGNMTTSGFLRSNNHYLIIENEEMTDYYRREFEQMYYGRYGSRKTPFSTNNNFLVNFTDLQVFYSPYNGDDAMNRIISLVDNAKTDIKYMIFAHTHDELTTAMIRAARRGVLVRGVHDKTFIRGTSEEAPRLYSAGRYMPGGPFPRQDGNEFTAIKGIASHGGKMHCKSMIVDNEWIATGSFNWSTNAVENNDENLVVFRNPFIAQELIQQWQDAWDISQDISLILYEPAGDAASYGDVVISEVMWAGSYEGTSYQSDDDWIELYNTTNRDIDISHWAVTWDTAETVTYAIPDQFNWYKPGVASRHYSTGRLIIPAGRYFLLKAINNGAIATEDNKISGTKDFALSESVFHIRLYDSRMELIDEAGFGDPAPAGRLDSFNRVAYSIERFFYPSGHPQAGKAFPGIAVGSWYTSNGNDQTGGNLAGLGQLNSTFRTCNASGQQCTIGTPNYSGNASSKVNPSTATGGENALTNIPVAAWSTGTNSATVQMRWAMQAAPTVAGGSCACTASLNPSDPSQLLVSTQAQTSGTTYTFNVGTATDITGGTSTAGSISYTGHGQSRAQVQIYRVYPQQSSSEDIVVLRALTSGSLYNLGIYFYDFSGPNPILFHRMRDVSVTAGQFIQLTVDKSCSVPCGVASVTSEDVRVGSSPSFSITANPNSATAGNIDSTGLASNATWEVFSSVPGMSSTDGIIFISYSLSESPMDLMCYSNRDGDVSFGLMLGGFRSLNAFGSSVYPFIYPVDNANDSAVQGRCSLWPSSGSGDYLQRVQDTNSAGDFVWVDG